MTNRLAVARSNGERNLSFNFLRLKDFGVGAVAVAFVPCSFYMAPHLYRAAIFQSHKCILSINQIDTIALIEPFALAHNKEYRFAY